MVLLTDIYLVFKKIAMIEKIKNKIFWTLKIQISFDCIVFSFRVFDAMIEINFNDFENFQIINFMFIFKDIFNLKT